jgi:ectoine hydroxylase-related dioxygenase (phytanoyl-CoA dioxygenase family)
VELFQSLNFERSTQQRAHSDFIHMTTFPPGNLIAAWVALEDIHPDSGPLHYYRGSHQLPYVLNREIGNVGTRTKLGPKAYADYEDYIEGTIHEHGLQKEIFLPRQGDVFIWHANLLHGAEPIADPQQTRKSMVFHYFAKEAVCFHEISQRPALKRVPVFTHV